MSNQVGGRFQDAIQVVQSRTELRCAWQLTICKIDPVVNLSKANKPAFYNQETTEVGGSNMLISVSSSSQSPSPSPKGQ